MSYLIEVRGLKHCFFDLYLKHTRSYLIEVRGLKHTAVVPSLYTDVVSYRGTWIETSYESCGDTSKTSRIL